MYVFDFKYKNSVNKFHGILFGIPLAETRWKEVGGGMAFCRVGWGAERGGLLTCFRYFRVCPPKGVFTNLVEFFSGQFRVAPSPVAFYHQLFGLCVLLAELCPPRYR